ncbi:MAG: hypothetical protein Rubg2KO_13380 [Rubricoccaceae bacterium]
MSCPLSLCGGLVALAILAGCASPGPRQLVEPPTVTAWDLQPSFMHDALAFLGVLSGDPFYTERYPDEFAHFDSLLTPTAREAIQDLAQSVKEEGRIVSAHLTLVFSASEAETLPEMQAVLDAPSSLREAFLATPYASDWPLFERNVPALRVALEWYAEIDFPGYWDWEIRPQAEARIAELAPQLPALDVLGETAQLTGQPAPLDTLTVYVLHFVKPHGIKITGSRFLTATTWPLSVVLPDAVHEMMHPPYDLSTDLELRAALDRLRNDPFLMERIENHDPSLGYTTFEGFVEENVVQALEQVALERLGVDRDPRAHWCRQDGGLHVLAAALYHTMTEEGFVSSRESIRSFLVRETLSGALQPGRLRAQYDSFYAGVSCES